MLQRRESGLAAGFAEPERRLLAYFFAFGGPDERFESTVGGFVGPYMMGWLKEFSGSYVVGLLAVAAIIFASTLASLSLKLFISRE